MSSRGRAASARREPRPMASDALASGLAARLLQPYLLARLRRLALHRRRRGKELLYIHTPPSPPRVLRSLCVRRRRASNFFTSSRRQPHLEVQPGACALPYLLSSLRHGRRPCCLAIC